MLRVDMCAQRWIKGRRHGGECGIPSKKNPYNKQLWFFFKDVNSEKWQICFLYHDSMCVCSVTQLCPTLYDPVDCGLPGSSVHGISQARIWKWFDIFFSRGSSQPRGRKLCLLSLLSLAGGFFTTEPLGKPDSGLKIGDMIFFILTHIHLLVDFHIPWCIIWYPDFSNLLFKGKQRVDNFHFWDVAP